MEQASSVDNAQPPWIYYPASLGLTPKRNGPLGGLLALKGFHTASW